jgi:hypothetical protein
MFSMDEPEPTPVIPASDPAVLAYANFRGQQPDGSRITCVVTEDSLKMTEVPLPRTGRSDMRIGLFFAALGVLIVGVAVAEIITLETTGRDLLGLVLVTLLVSGPLIAGGVGMFLQGSARGSQEICIEIRDGMLWVAVPNIFKRRWQWAITPGLKVETIGKSLGMGYSSKGIDVTGSVAVRRSRWPIYRVIFATRTRAECDWVVRELTAATDRQLQLKVRNHSADS